MDVLTLENLVFNLAPATLKMAQEGLAIKTGDNIITIPRENIRNIDIFRSARAFCLRIQASDTQTIYDLLNLHESLLGKLRATASSFYGLTPQMTELEIKNTAHGNLFFTNNLIELRNEKRIFNIPKEAIRQIIELDNDLEFHLDGVDIVFNTSSEIATLITSKVAEEVCIISMVNCIHPRSKSNLVFFNDYFVLKGSSYDHTVPYRNIEDILFLRKESDFYLVLKLASPVVQGQTKYESIVFLLQNKEIEVVAKDSRLRSFYKDTLPAVLLEVFESLSHIKAQESEKSIKCTAKVFEGYMYLLNDTIQFLPKAISIPLNEVSHVEFSRINLSMAQAKTFDMTIFSSKVYNFTGIRKEAFNDLEIYLNKNNIRIVSEVIEESFSSSRSDESDGSDLSDIIDSGDE